MNRVEFSGVAETVEPKRMSPAGVPSVRMTLEHRSTADEAGGQIQVVCRMRVVAVGPVALQAEGVQAGDEVEIEGFLARASYRSEWPVLHAQALRIRR